MWMAYILIYSFVPCLRHVGLELTSWKMSGTMQSSVYPWPSQRVFGTPSEQRHARSNSQISLAKGEYGIALGEWSCDCEFPWNFKLLVGLNYRRMDDEDGQMISTLLVNVPSASSFSSSSTHQIS